MSAATRARGYFVVTFMLAGCEESSQPEPAEKICSEDEFDLLGVRVDEDLGCLLTEEGPRPVACQGDRDESVPYSHSCVRHIESSETFWVTISSRERVLADGWEACSDRVADPPPPCFARECPPNELGPSRPAYPHSLCTEAETRALFECGGAQSVWDENCCRRPLCERDADCTAAGEICRQINGSWGYLHAWPYVDGYANYSGTGCDSGGVLGGGGGRMCISRDACTPAVYPGLACDEIFGGNACGECLVRSCCDAVDACTADNWCAGLMECSASSCYPGNYRNAQDRPCFEESCPGCPESATGRDLLDALAACAATRCAVECEY